MIDRICLWRIGGAGDVFLTLPVIQELKRTIPGVTITLFGHKYAAELLRDAGLVNVAVRQSTGSARQYDGVLEVLGRIGSTPYSPRDREQYQRLLGNPDLMFAWSTDSLRASLALESWGVKRAIVEYWQPPVGIHQSEFMINSLRNAGIMSKWTYDDGIDPLVLPFDVKPGILPRAFNRSRSVIIHPGAGGEWKRWGIDRFQKLSFELDRDGWTTFVIQGPEEESDEYRTLFPRSLILRDLSLSELAAIFQYKFPYIGNDAGMTHLAAACGCPTTAIFIATNPQEWCPIGPNVRALSKCENQPTGDSRTCYDESCKLKVTIDDVLQSFEYTLSNRKA